MRLNMQESNLRNFRALTLGSALFLCIGLRAQLPVPSRHLFGTGEGRTIASENFRVRESRYSVTVADAENALRTTISGTTFYGVHFLQRFRGVGGDARAPFQFTMEASVTDA